MRDLEEQIEGRTTWSRRRTPQGAVGVLAHLQEDLHAVGLHQQAATPAVIASRALAHRPRSRLRCAREDLHAALGDEAVVTHVWMRRARRPPPRRPTSRRHQVPSPGCPSRVIEGAAPAGRQQRRSATSSFVAALHAVNVFVPLIDIADAQNGWPSSSPKRTSTTTTAKARPARLVKAGHALIFDYRPRSQTRPRQRTSDERPRSSHRVRIGTRLDAGRTLAHAGPDAGRASLLVRLQVLRSSSPTCTTSTRSLREPRARRRMTREERAAKPVKRRRARRGQGSRAPAEDRGVGVAAAMARCQYWPARNPKREEQRRQRHEAGRPQRARCCRALRLVT